MYPFLKMLAIVSLIIHNPVPDILYCYSLFHDPNPKHALLFRELSIIPSGNY